MYAAVPFALWENAMTEKELWKEFVVKNNIKAWEYDAWSFGTEADLLAKLVVDGEKTATASAYPLYQLENEPLPQIGKYNVILNSKDEAVCIIRTKKVYRVPFNEVTKEHAYKEGEGNRTLEFWRKVHKAFFSECLKEFNLEFTSNMEVVCEEFEVVYKK